MILIWVLLLLYALAVLYFFLFQKLYIYPASQARLDADPFPKDMSIFAQDINGTTLHGLYQKTGARKLMVFFHLNAQAASAWRHMADEHFAQYGYDTFLAEYPGYASLGGKPSIKKNREMVEATASWIETQDYDEIMITGFSLGTAMAAMLAPRVNASKVLLFASFDRMTRAVRDRMPILPSFIVTENYESDVELQNFKNPIVIVYGERDVTVKPERSLKLAKALHNAKIVKIRNANHMQIMSNDIISQIFEREIR